MRKNTWLNVNTFPHTVFRVLVSRPRAVVGRITKTEKVGPCTCTCTCAVASVARKQPVDVLRFDLKAVSVYGQILQFHCSNPVWMYNCVDKYERGNVERMHDRGIKVVSLNSNFFYEKLFKMEIRIRIRIKSFIFLKRNIESNFCFKKFFCGICIRIECILERTFFED